MSQPSTCSARWKKVPRTPPTSFAVMLYGNPVWNVAIPVVSQPPISRSVARFTLVAIFFPRPKGRL